MLPESRKLGKLLVRESAKTELRLRVRACAHLSGGLLFDTLTQDAETGQKPRVPSRWSPWSAAEASYKMELVKRGNKTLVIPEGTPESLLGLLINKFTRG